MYTYIYLSLSFNVYQYVVCKYKTLFESSVLFCNSRGVFEDGVMSGVEEKSPLDIGLKI